MRAPLAPNTNHSQTVFGGSAAAVAAAAFATLLCTIGAGMLVQTILTVDGVDAGTLGLDGTETFDLPGAEGPLTPRQRLPLVVRRKDGRVEEVPLTLRIDTPVEAEYQRHGGILPYVLRQLVG